jgi:glycosyltransferase involved in cell wall biosynthesis
MSKVSVIVPVYNAEKYLRQCLDSVLNQTLRDIEIICVNDGSTDGSLAILEEYAKKDSRVVVINQKNQGAGLARNKGIEVVKGEYIHFMDSDDYLVDGAYEKFYSIAKNNDLDIIRGKSHVFDEINKEVTSMGYYELKDIFKNQLFNKIMCFYDFPKIFIEVAVSPWMGLYKTHFIREYNVLYNDLICVNDRSFWIKSLINAKKIMFIDEYMEYHRRNVPMSLINIRDKHFSCHFLSFGIIENIVKDLPKEIQNIVLRRELEDMCNWYEGFKNTESIHVEDIRKSIKKFLKEIEPDIIPNRLFSLKDGMPKISVIIPVYNMEKYLRKCVDSVINQTLKDIEIICVNDGSTDGSLAILEEYAEKDSRIIIVNQKNGGLSCARNSGLDIAKAAYITFVDSDDWIESNMCEVFFNIIEKERVDLVVGNVAVIEDIEKDEYIEKRSGLVAQYYDSFNTARGKHKFSGNFLSYRPSAWGKLYKKSIIDKRNFRFPDGLINEDEAWHWYYFSTIKTLYLTDTRFYNRLICVNSIMYNLNVKQEKIFDLIYVLENVYDYLIENRLYRKYKQEYKDYFEKKSKNIKHRCSDACRHEVMLKLKALEKKISVGAEADIKKRLSTRFFERIFSIKNDGIHKVFCFIGLKIKVKNKKLETLRELQEIKQIEIKQNENLSKLCKGIADLRQQNENLSKLWKEFDILRQQVKQQYENYAQILPKELLSLKDAIVKKQKDLETSIKAELQNRFTELNKRNAENNIKVTGGIEELRFAEVFNNTIVQSQWLKDRSFSPNDYAANYSLLYFLFKILDETKPKNILELGVGQTTKMTSQYAGFYKTYLDIVDSEQSWIDLYKQKINLSDNIKIHCLPLTNFDYCDTINIRYDNLDDVVRDKKYDLIIVDGPFGDRQQYPRANIVDLLYLNLAQDFVIVIDDFNRTGEQRTANLVLSKLDSKQIRYDKKIIKAKKHQILIYSPSLSYVSTL